MYNLLIVDDEPEIRQALSNYIPWEEMGFIVANTAKNGKEALDYIINNKVDVLLCDVKMPIMNGVELAKEIYSQNIKTKVIFLSAYREFDFAKKALLYGVEDYIIKPTKYQELLDVFKNITNKLEKEGRKSSFEKQLTDLSNCKDDIDYFNNCSESFNDKIIIKVKNIVRENYQTASLKDIAKKVNLSSCYLSKFFKEITGENFSDYVLRIKMNEAKKLLMDIDYCVYEVSEMLGYSNAKNFSRAFKCFTGKTPSEFRKGGG